MPPTLSRKLVADTLPRKLRGGCLCGVACTSTGASALLEAASAAGLQTANYGMQRCYHVPGSPCNCVTSLATFVGIHGSQGVRGRNGEQRGHLA